MGHDKKWETPPLPNESSYEPILVPKEGFRFLLARRTSVGACNTPPTYRPVLGRVMPLCMNGLCLMMTCGTLGCHESARVKAKAKHKMQSTKYTKTRWTHVGPLCSGT